MSLNHSPFRSEPAIRIGRDGSSRGSEASDFWNCLINEKEAGAFLGVVPRTLQGWRQKGGGPRFVRISSRYVRYRRVDLEGWAEGRMRASTADDGQAA